MMEQPKKAKAAPEESAMAAKGRPPAGRTLAISARQAGFRRAGRAWSVEPTIVSTDEFTNEQLWQLAHEPMLVITPCAPPVLSEA